MLNRTKLSLAVSAALGAGLIGFAPGAIAQTQAQPQTMDRVEVTGSLLRRIEGETSLPVTTLNMGELERAGVTNAEQAVKFVQQSQAATVSSTTVSGTNGGASYANLRALGSGRTLVLLNGKRVVNNPFASAAVDLNTLPMSSIDRIEVLSDGASATYGTDAIAGVINFITRKEYQGITVGGEAQLPEEGGGEVYVANLLGGIGNLGTQGWNVYGGFNYRKQQPLGGTERDFMKSSFIPSHGFDGTSPTTFPANYSQNVSGVATVPSVNPYARGCFPPSSINVRNNAFCSADTQIFTNVVPEQEQISAFLKGALALGQNNTLSGEFFWARNTITSQIAPSPEGGLTMTPASPFYPGNGINPLGPIPSTAPGLNTTQPISIAWRTTLLGPRQTEHGNDTWRAVAQLDGTVANWDYQVAALYSKSETTNTFIGGWPKTVPLRNGVQGINGAPFLNPFGNQTAAGMAYVLANQVLGEMQNGEGTLWSINAVASTTFGNLAGGPMAVAFGTEYREEDMVYNTNVAEVSQAASSGLAGSGAVREGDRDIWALAAEMNFPVLKNLDFTLAVRYDDYSDFGGTTNPKVSFRYTPIEMLLLRGSYNTGFAAPSLTSMYLPNSTTFTGNRYNDPVLCPGGVVNTAAGGVSTRDCGLQFQQMQGGNVNLDAETSEAWTVGFVLQVTPELSFSLDYWDYYIEDSISTIGEQSIFADPVKYSSLFVRCSQADPARRQAIGACQVPGGDPLAYIINTNQNLGDVKTTGFDISLVWNGTATEWGRFSAAARGTYITKYEFQVEPDGTWYNPVGNYNPQNGGPVLRYQQITTVNWSYQDWTATLSNQYQSGYFDQNAAGSVYIPAYRQHSVGKTSIWNLGGTWSGYKGLTLMAGVLNIFDEDPEYSNQAARFQARGYDDRFSNPLGRVWTLGARYEFM